MPKKIRELKAMLRKAGFSCKSGKGKSHKMDTSKTGKKGGSVRKGRGGRQTVSGRRSSAGDKGREAKRELTARYSMVIQWSDIDDTYVVTLPEFGGCKTHGDTYEKAAKSGREVLELLIESSIEDGEELPEPTKFGSPVSN